jgi:transaldolase
MLRFYGQVLENHIITYRAKQLGCHIITIPPSIIEKIEKFGKSFDQLTKETVKAFWLIVKSLDLKFKRIGCGGRI